jgi:hypothetical protein
MILLVGLKFSPETRNGGTEYLDSSSSEWICVPDEPGTCGPRSDLGPVWSRAGSMVKPSMGRVNWD